MVMGTLVNQIESSCYKRCFFSFFFLFSFTLLFGNLHTYTHTYIYILWNANSRTAETNFIKFSLLFVKVKLDGGGGCESTRRVCEYGEY